MRKKKSYIVKGLNPVLFRTTKQGISTLKRAQSVCQAYAKETSSTLFPCFWRVYPRVYPVVNASFEHPVHRKALECPSHPTLHMQL